MPTASVSVRGIKQAWLGQVWSRLVCAHTTAEQALASFLKASSSACSLAACIAVDGSGRLRQGHMITSGPGPAVGVATESQEVIATTTERVKKSNVKKDTQLRQRHAYESDGRWLVLF